MLRCSLSLALLAAACTHHADPAATADPRVSLDAPHPDAPHEWWHVHAHLQDAITGEPVHLFLSFAVQRDAGGELADVHTAWVRFQDPEQRTFAADKRDSTRSRFVGDGLDLRQDDWRITADRGELIVWADAGPHELQLRLSTLSAPRPEPDGLHVERVGVQGRWDSGEERHFVTGTGFYKHQWGTDGTGPLDEIEWFSGLKALSTAPLAGSRDSCARSTPSCALAG